MNVSRPKIGNLPLFAAHMAPLRTQQRSKSPQIIARHNIRRIHIRIVSIFGALPVNVLLITSVLRVRGPDVRSPWYAWHPGIDGALCVATNNMPIGVLLTRKRKGECTVAERSYRAPRESGN